MRIAVIGAGLAGIAAARHLVAEGHRVRLIEKSRGLGGRVASRRAEGAVLDHGSPFLAAPPGSALRRLADALHLDDQVELPEGIGFRTGATRLPKAVAAGLDVLLGVRLAALRPAGDAFELGDEQGNTHGAADGVIVTAPAPQAADLLERSPEAGERVALLRTLAYLPAVMLLAGVPGAEQGPAVARPGGVLAEVRREAAKDRLGAGAAPVVARLAEGPSAELLDASDAEVLDLAVPALRDAVGEPAWTQVKRWRYAVPDGRLDDGAVNPPGTRVVVAGDAITGAGFGDDAHPRVWEDGERAARRLVAALAGVPA